IATVAKASVRANSTWDICIAGPFDRASAAAQTLRAERATLMAQLRPSGTGPRQAWGIARCPAPPVSPGDCTPGLIHARVFLYSFPGSSHDRILVPLFRPKGRGGLRREAARRG